MQNRSRCAKCDPCGTWTADSCGVKVVALYAIQTGCSVDAFFAHAWTGQTLFVCGVVVVTGLAVSIGACLIGLRGAGCAFR